MSSFCPFAGSLTITTNKDLDVSYSMFLPFIVNNRLFGSKSKGLNVEIGKGRAITSCISMALRVEADRLSVFFFANSEDFSPARADFSILRFFEGGDFAPECEDSPSSAFLVFDF